MSIHPRDIRPGSIVRLHPRLNEDFITSGPMRVEDVTPHEITSDTVIDYHDPEADMERWAYIEQVAEIVSY